MINVLLIMQKEENMKLFYQERFKNYLLKKKLTIGKIYLIILKFKTKRYKIIKNSLKVNRQKH